MPQVSVLMTVYNGMPDVREAVASVRAQTLSDWELIIVDDGSTDETADWLDQLTDPRIRVVHQANQGPGGASNTGLALCRCEFVARLDADDVALPTRLEKQLAYLRDHPRVGLLGSQIALLFEGRARRGGALPCDHRTIDAKLIRGRHAICNSSIMCRTQWLREIGGYWPRGLSEDWDMFLRMSERAELANLPEVLLHVRVAQTSLQSQRMAEVRNRLAYACHAAIRRRAGQGPISYEQFCDLRNNDPWWQRLARAIELRAMMQYRKAQPEILGKRPLVGYGRLAIAAAMSPHLTAQRLWRLVRHRLFAPRRRDPKGAVTA